MEERIKRSIVKLKVAFAGFWSLALCLIVAGETETAIQLGLYAGDVRMSYCWETISILLTAACVPVSLKLYAVIMLKKIDKADIDRAVRMYVVWNLIRLLLLALPLVVGLLTYYWTLDSTGLLCALIALTASLFCLPTEKRFRNELHIDKED